jgi:phosphopantothenoylcysteine decarboxylase/phosphopantothenate--cysteine ligase
MIGKPLPPQLAARNRLHLGVTGSIAAFKALDLLRVMLKLGLHVNVTLTEAAQRFVTPLSFEALGAGIVYTGMFANTDDDAYGHLQPGQNSCVMLVAPCTADFLARLAHGMANDMLSAQALAFAGPIVIAPAMNPRMWSNPATQSNVDLLLERDVRIVWPVGGQVACGDEGQGKMASVDEILAVACQAFAPQDMVGKSVMVTMGPTQEPWDSVRLWTNRSTGLMGACLAQAAWLRGADVFAVAGPGCPSLPEGIRRFEVTTAEDMFEAALDLWPRMDYGLFAAAVADFSPVPFTDGKFKKSDHGEGMSVNFRRNVDILASLAEQATEEQRILGFAAESDKLEERARHKLLAKSADLIAGNLIGGADAGFASDTNRMFVCDCAGREEHWPLMPKTEVAWRLLDWLLTL